MKKPKKSQVISQPHRALKRWVFDFETTTIEPYKVWAWGASCLEEDEIHIGQDLETFLEFIYHQPNTIFFALNAKFDFSFIAYRVLNKRTGWKIERQSFTGKTKSFRKVILVKDNVKVEFRDASPLFAPSFISLKAIIKGWCDGKWEKGKTPLLETKPRTLKKEWIEYLKTDVLALKYALKKRFELLPNSALTTSSDVKRLLFKNKSIKKCFEGLTIKEDSEIRRFYRGGYCYLNPVFSHLLLDDVVVYDVNSMYPAIMSGRLPIGKPHPFLGEPPKDKLFCKEIEIHWAQLKEGYPPSLPLSGGGIFGATEYASCITENSLRKTFFLVDQELEYFKEAYDAKFTEKGGFWFNFRVNPLDDFIPHYMAIKENSEGAERECAKLVLNCPSGKMGQNPDGEVYRMIGGEVLSFVKEEADPLDPIFIPFSVFTTAYARVKIWRSILEAGLDNFVYTDTDSLHLVNGARPKNVHKSQLGAWKIDKIYKEAKYLRTKRYAGRKEGATDLDFTVAGIDGKRYIAPIIKDLEDFKEGVPIPLQRMRQGIGGMGMVDMIVEL